MSTLSQADKAEAFLSLHRADDLLLLPNVWDPIGARVLEARGYPAVATASAAVSASLGYADGERINRATLLMVLSRIAESVDVPVTADIESGYGSSLSELRESVGLVLDAGVVGVNLEDSPEEEGPLRSIDEQCERLSAVRDVADARGVHLVINARIDSFLSSSFSNPDERVEDCVLRAGAYAAAGADCIYPIGPGDYETLSHLRRRIAAPLNVLGSPRAEPLTVLRDLGIDRVSFGPFVFRSCLGKLIEIVDGLADMGGYDDLARGMLSGDDVAEFLRQGHE